MIYKIHELIHFIKFAYTCDIFAINKMKKAQNRHFLNLKFFSLIHTYFWIMDCYHLFYTLGVVVSPVLLCLRDM